MFDYDTIMGPIYNSPAISLQDGALHAVRPPKLFRNDQGVTNIIDCRSSWGHGSPSIGLFDASVIKQADAIAAERPLRHRGDACELFRVVRGEPHGCDPPKAHRSWMGRRPTHSRTVCGVTTAPEEDSTCVSIFRLGRLAGVGVLRQLAGLDN